MGEDDSTARPAGGVITAVRAQKKDPTRVSVFVDGAFAFGLTADTALTEGLRKGLVLSQADQERILAADSHAAARATALAYLTGRARTVAEVRRKLTASEFGEAAIEGAIARLQELGYLDDRQYARRYAAGRLDRKYGPRRIVQELRRRGIVAELAESAVRDAREERDVEDLARELAMTRAARLKSETDERKRKKKVYDFLVRRGFDSDVAWSAVNAIQEREWN